MTDEPTGELDDATAGEVLDAFDAVNRELNTTILIVTHDPEISKRVDRVVMIRDGKMSTEIRRRSIFRRPVGDEEAEAPTEEFALVDGAGRVQIPKEYLDELKIKGRTRVSIEDGKVVLVSGDD
jgi:ABC-type glutathione transport system ATPase component